MTTSAAATVTAVTVAVAAANSEFTHGDLQVTHVFVDGDEITRVLDVLRSRL
jgi:hypothetical protein